MSILNKKNATTTLNIIAAIPVLIQLGRMGANAGRAIVAAIKGKRA